MSHAPFESSFAHNIYKGRYSYDGKEEWADTSERVVKHVFGALNDAPNPLPRAHCDLAKEVTYDLMSSRRFIPGGRYLYASGRDLHQVQNCLLMRAEDTREGWADLAWKAGMALMTGAGIGVTYSDVRGSGAVIQRTGGTASGPVPLMMSVNDQGRCYMQGGQRRSAIYASLHWWHTDAPWFIRAKDYPTWLREQKAKDFTVAAPLDATNISVALDDEFFLAYEGNPLPAEFTAKHGERAPNGESWQSWAQMIYAKTVDKMVTTGEPGFQIDVGKHAGEDLRNACTEVTSADDSDICNLGAIVLPRFHSPEQFGAAVRHATLFLTAGTLYSDVPYAKVAEVREKNRRLGLGIMGGYEFCVMRGVKYGSDEAHELLLPYMQEYARALEYAQDWQAKLGLTLSIAATAMAPHGTTGIIAETTTSDEPPPAAAYKRRVRMGNASEVGDRYTVEYVMDPSVKRALDLGIKPEILEDAHTLATDYERRFKHQVFTQQFVDQGISSTFNLPHVMKGKQEQRDFADTLYKYLPGMRGVTCYPEGSRPGQPITPVPVEEAMHQIGLVIEEDEEKCAGGVCGI